MNTVLYTVQCTCFSNFRGDKNKTANLIRLSFFKKSVSQQGQTVGWPEECVDSASIWTAKCQCQLGTPPASR
jgi:hypothetical protein